MTEDTPRHSLLDDAQAIGFAATMAAFSVTVLTHLGLVTGQTAGLALLISYATGWDFGPVFFVINLPFYWLGWKRIGLGFVVKTFLAVALVTALTQVLPGQISFAHLSPGFGALLAGLASGTALLAHFRHGASLGGIGILALWLQDRTGFRAGWTQIAFDTALFAAALAYRDLPTLAWSALGALAVNLTIAFNHRRDRYIVR